MGSNACLDVDGITGTSTDSGHAGQIDLLSYSFGSVQTGSFQYGGGSSTGEVKYNDMNFSKSVDASSTAFFAKCADGSKISKAKLFVQRAGADKSEKLTYTMYDIYITSVQYNKSNPNDLNATESVSLNFAKIETEYKPPEVFCPRIRIFIFKSGEA
ncbi:MAG: type VI secretion system tube protein Hcp [Acidobacteriota bacterium]